MGFVAGTGRGGMKVEEQFPLEDEGASHEQHNIQFSVDGVS